MFFRLESDCFIRHGGDQISYVDSCNVNTQAPQSQSGSHEPFEKGLNYR